MRNNFQIEEFIIKAEMSLLEYNIDVNWDEKAGVWYAVCDAIPLALESNSFDALIQRAKITAYEILELNSKLSKHVSLCFRTNHREQIA